ncbi:MAG TPA: PQQ-binding-like beta-propeller repeat protein, partial [Gemmataceae bacterium]|nr:PQQ-binding-like beta-propeller repeat protein [Gemmataceae bacterium]
AVRERSVDSRVEKALRAPAPARRSAAAYLAGRFGDAGQRAAVRVLLADVDFKVRLRSAQGLVAARDKAAVPVLFELLGDVRVPTAVSWQAEELLYRIAGDQGPAVSVGAGGAGARKKCQAAWARWWRDHAAKVDLARVTDEQRLLGLTLVAELDSNKVWECGRDGKPRWTLDGLGGPIDAQALPGGRVLVAENQQSRVTERDLKGKIVWEKALNQSPIVCQRLPNGNTFIATYNSVLEVTRDGKEVYSHSPGGNFFIYGAHRMRNGHIACISGQGEILDLDGAGKVVKTIPVTTNGGWCGVEGLPGGRFLVAVTGQNKVLEVDGSGKTVWECSVNGAGHATRLPNGNTLVASMMGNRVVEVNRAGKTVWEQTTVGRPFHVHRR